LSGEYPDFPGNAVFAPRDGGANGERWGKEPEAEAAARGRRRRGSAREEWRRAESPRRVPAAAAMVWGFRGGGFALGGARARCVVTCAALGFNRGLGFALPRPLCTIA
jgi:hypothetical protein